MLEIDPFTDLQHSKTMQSGSPSNYISTELLQLCTSAVFIDHSPSPTPNPQWDLKHIRLNRFGMQFTNQFTVPTQDQLH